MLARLTDNGSLTAVISAWDKFTVLRFIAGYGCLGRHACICLSSHFLAALVLSKY